MTLTVIGSLQKQGLFAKDSAIPNISIILALLVKHAWTRAADFDCWEDNTAWVFPVVEQAKEAGISLSGPAKFADIMTEIDAKAPEQTAASRNKWTKGTFVKKVC